MIHPGVAVLLSALHCALMGVAIPSLARADELPPLEAFLIDEKREIGADEPFVAANVYREEVDPDFGK